MSLLQLSVRTSKTSFYGQNPFRRLRWHDGSVIDWSFRRSLSTGCTPSTSLDSESVKSSALSSIVHDGHVPNDTITGTASQPLLDDNDEVCAQRLWEWWSRGSQVENVETRRKPILVLWMTQDSDFAEQTRKLQPPPEPKRQTSSWQKLPLSRDKFLSSFELRQKYYGLSLITQHRIEQEEQEQLQQQQPSIQKKNSGQTFTDSEQFLEMEVVLARLESLGQIGVEFRDRGDYYRDWAQFWDIPSKFRTVSVIHLHSTARPSIEWPEWCNDNRMQRGIQHIVRLSHSVTKKIIRSADLTAKNATSKNFVVQVMVCTDCGQKHDPRHFHIVLERRNRDWLERALMKWDPKDLETYDYSDVIIPTCPHCRIGLLRPHVIENTKSIKSNHPDVPVFDPEFQPPPPIPAYQSRLCQAAIEAAPAVLLVGDLYNITQQQLEPDLRHPWSALFPHLASASKNNVPIAILDTSDQDLTPRPVEAWDHEKLSVAAANWTASAGPVLQVLANRMEEDDRRQALAKETKEDDDETESSPSSIAESDPNPLVFLNELRAGRKRLYWETVGPD